MAVAELGAAPGVIETAWRDDVGRYVHLTVPESQRMADPSQAVVVRWLAAGDVVNLDAFDYLLHHDPVIHAALGLSASSAEAEAEKADSGEHWPPCPTFAMRFKRL